MEKTPSKITESSAAGGWVLNYLGSLSAQHESLLKMATRIRELEAHTKEDDEGGRKKILNLTIQLREATFKVVGNTSVLHGHTMRWQQAHHIADELTPTEIVRSMEDGNGQD